MDKPPKRLRSPITWFGGKGRMTAKILPLFPEHHIYVEPFGGGASMLLAKPPAPVEVYNDLDSGLVNFFRVLRDPTKAMRLTMLAMLTPHSREEYLRYRETWADAGDEIEQAYRWFYVARHSFAGHFGASWGFAVKQSSRGMAQRASAWLSTIDQLAAVHDRLMRVQIEHADFRRIIDTYDTPATLFYLDPPYVAGTRRSGEYQHELTDDDHRELVDRLLGIQGKVLMSGYPNELYKPLEKAGWKRRDFQVACNAAARTRATGLLGKGGLKDQQRTESVWVSPSAQAQAQAARGKRRGKARGGSKPKLAGRIHATPAPATHGRAVA